MVATTTVSLNLEASDLSGQNIVRIRDIPADRTVGEFINEVVPRMGLVDRIEDRPVSYTARLDRVGRHLHAAERVADAVEEGDRLVLTPAINAG